MPPAGEEPGLKLRGGMEGLPRDSDQTGRGMAGGHAVLGSAKTRGFHTQLDEGPETP